MNYNFFRRATSSFIASLFALSFAVGSVEPVNGEENQVINTCQKNSGKFRIPLADKKPLKIAIVSSGTLDLKVAVVKGKSTPEQYKLIGIDKIIAGKLSRNNKFEVADWDRIKPFTKNNKTGVSSETSVDNITKKQLHDIREKDGVEVVAFITANQFHVNKTEARNYFLFSKDKEINQVSVTLNFRLVDTTTGYIVGSGEVIIDRDDSYTTSVKTPTINIQQIGINSGQSFKPRITITFTNNNANSNPTIPNYPLGNDGYYQTPNYSENSSGHQLVKDEKTGIEKKLLVQAFQDAIEGVVEQLDTVSNQTACSLRIPTVVVDVDNDEKTVTLAKGKLHGFSEGMELSFQGSRQPLIHPITEEVVRIKTKRIKGLKIRLTDVKSSFSVGRIVPDSSDNKTEVDLVKFREIKRLSENHQLFAKPIPEELSASSQNTGESNTNSEKTKNQSSITYPYSKASRSASDLKLQNMFFNL